MCLNVFKAFGIIATLGSIMDSQLSWESGKYLLARGSHEVVLFSVRTRPDPTRPDHPVKFRDLLFLSMLCGVPTPIVPLFNKVCALSPRPSTPQLFTQSRKYQVSHKKVYPFFSKFDVKIWTNGAFQEIDCQIRGWFQPKITQEMSPK